MFQIGAVDPGQKRGKRSQGKKDLQKKRRMAVVEKGAEASAQQKDGCKAKLTS